MKYRMANRTRKNSRKNNTRKHKGGKNGSRKLNPYMKFAQQERPKILKAHPEMRSDVVSVAKEIGKRWRALKA